MAGRWSALSRGSMAMASACSARAASAAARPAPPRPARASRDHSTMRGELGDLGAHLAHLARRLGDRLELGVVAARLDEGLALERTRAEPRLELGKAVRDLAQAFVGDGHWQSHSPEVRCPDSIAVIALIHGQAEGSSTRNKFRVTMSMIVHLVLQRTVAQRSQDSHRRPTADQRHRTQSSRTGCAGASSVSTSTAIKALYADDPVVEELAEHWRADLPAACACEAPNSSA